MPRLLLRFLLALGIFLLLLGAGIGSTGMIVLGTFVLVAGVITTLRMVVILTNDQVIDDWSALIGNGQGNAEGVLEDTAKFIEQSKAPDLNMERKRVAPGTIGAILGKQRDYLVVTESGNAQLKPYQIFLNCRDYGNNLAVDWHLTFRGSFWQALVSAVFASQDKPNPFLELDLFDRQDLRSYVTNAHRCLLKAVDNLMLKLAQDPSSIDRKSRGFLGIS